MSYELPLIRQTSCCGRVNRRVFLADCGMGFTGLVLGAMLNRDGMVRAEGRGEWLPPDGKAHFAPRAKSVIWLFMLGGVSHIESFDPKPMLQRYAGKTIEDTPYKAVLDSPFTKKNVVEFVAGQRKLMTKLFPPQVGHRKRGQSGIEISDWWPHVGDCVDDLAIVRSVWTTDNDHAAQLQFHTGRHVFQGFFPSIGSWVHYGLGTLNENLPQFVVLGEMPSPCCGGTATVSANYLGPEHSGVQLEVDPVRPLPFAQPGADVYEEEQIREFEFLGRLNQLAGVQYPHDPSLRARVKSYELAFRMQTTVPELFRFSEETPDTQKLYGLDQKVTNEFGQQCLTARRLVERGVRFVQIFHGSGKNRWDAHSELRNNHSKLCAEVDKPIAGLVKDLKQRGLLDETVVVWATEFGRTPGVEGEKGGRDHHPFGFSVWMAGGGIKGGIAHGATDELGFHAVEDRHYVTDIHATVLRQLGLDPRKLEIPGQKRLEIDFGVPIEQILV
jgi:Protein of unknown function (DUF1501)